MYFLLDSVNANALCIAGPFKKKEAAMNDVRCKAGCGINQVTQTLKVKRFKVVGVINNKGEVIRLKTVNESHYLFHGKEVKNAAYHYKA